jgi:hypothetical protein
MILPRWRQLLPLDFPRPYFDAFVVRQRAALESVVAAWLDRRAARRALVTEGMTPAKRTRRNLEAMRIVATRRPQDMTAEERRAVLGYSGWGGLSIEGSRTSSRRTSCPTTSPSCTSTLRRGISRRHRRLRVPAPRRARRP